jgi:hypothetical protein
MLSHPKCQSVLVLDRRALLHGSDSAEMSFPFSFIHVAVAPKGSI